MRALALAIALTVCQGSLLPLPATAQVQKWVDEEGTIHLGGEGSSNPYRFLAPGSQKPDPPEVEWQLSLSYSPPKEIDYPKTPGGKETYLIIYYDVQNNIGEKVYANPKVVIIADGHRQYGAGFHPLVHGYVEKINGKKFETLLTLGGDLFPGVEKKALAIFGPWKINHKRIEVIFEGIAKAADWKDEDPFYQLIYERENKKWIQVSKGWK